MLNGTIGTLAEVKVSQLKSSQTNEFAGHFSPLTAMENKPVKGMKC
jgi:hypothetical protein